MGWCLFQFRLFIYIVFCFLIVNVVPSYLHAQLVDTVSFGNSASETTHNLVSTNTQIGAGQLGQSTRILEPYNPTGVYGGNVVFTMAVDPSAQNYLTIRLWGGDNSNGNNLWAKCNGYVVYNWPGAFGFGAVGKFLYRTVAIPLWQTRGQTSVQMELLSLGNQNYYARTPYDQYQYLVSQPSQPLYGAYIHTNAYFTPPATDIQAPVPAAPSPAPYVNPTTKIAQMEASENSTLLSELKQTTPLTQAQIQDLAQGYTTSWTSVYQNAAVIPQVINNMDTLVAGYYTGGAANGQWGGSFFEAGYGITLLYNIGAISQSALNSQVSYGVGGTLPRYVAWSTALMADVNQSRYNRKFVTNQAFDADTGIYEANKAAELINPSIALPESQAQNYLMQDCGLAYYTGSDLPAGGSDYAEGKNYYMMTPKAGSRESGWVGSDYGIQTVQQTEQFWEITGNPIFLNRAVQMLQDRAHFEYPANDGTLGNGTGYYSMVVADVIDIRNQYIPGRPYYVDIATAGASLDPTSVAYAQQVIADNQLFSNIGLPSVWVLAKYYPIIAAQPAQSARMPLTPGQPNNAFVDELDQVVSAHYNGESFFANMDFQSSGIDGEVRVFLQTPQYDLIGDVRVNDEYYYNAGTWLTGTGLSDSASYDVEPDDPIDDSYGVHYSYSTSNGGSARAEGYTFQYGNYLVGMNSDENDTTYQYTMWLPPGYTSAVDLISGKTFTSPVVLAPETSVVFYLPTVSTGQPLPSRPVFYTSVAGNAQVSLAWDPTSNAATYNVYRSTTSGGPYIAITQGLHLSSFMDTSVSNGTTYFYVVTAVNAAGESGYSVEEADTPIYTNLAFPWGYQTVTPYTDSGSATITGANAITLNSNTYSFGGNVFDRYDEFSYAYETLPGNGSLTARLVSMGSGNECGLDLRGTLSPTDVSASVQIYSGTKLQYSYRSSINTAPAQPTLASTAVTLPYWLQMVRNGFNFTAYGSTNGTSWTPIYAGIVPAASNSIDMGLGDGGSGACVFDNISASVFQNSNSTATVTGLIANPTTQFQGDSVTLTATVAAESQTSLTGMVTFYSGSTVLGTSTPGPSGVANLIVSTLPLGTNTITATYAGDVVLKSSTSVPLLVTIVVLPVPVLTIASSQNPAPGPGEAVTYTLTMTFSSAANILNGRAYIYDNFGGTTTQLFTNVVSQGTGASGANQLVISFSDSNLAVGTHPLTGFFDGSGSYASASTAVPYNQVIAVTHATNPSVNLSANPTSVQVNQTVMLTATVTGSTKLTPTGTVSFIDESNSSSPVTLGTVTLSATAPFIASLPIATLSAGVHTLVAEYSGDTNFFPQTSSAVTLTISLLNSVTTLSVSQTLIGWGSTEMFTATVTPAIGSSLLPSGIVNFLNNGSTTLGTGTLVQSTGMATFNTSSLAIGTYSVTASYVGDTKYAASTSAPITVQVTPVATTCHFSTSPTTLTYGSSESFVVSITPSTANGTITFSNGTVVLGTAYLSVGSANFKTSTLPVGVDNVTASYSGDTNDAAANCTPIAVTVTPIQGTVSLTGSTTSAAYGTTVSFTSALSPASGTGTITFENGGQPLSGNSAQNVSGSGNASFSTGLLPAGINKITAVYSGDTDDSPATSTVWTVTVTAANPTVSLTPSATYITYGTAETLTASLSPTSASGTVTFKDNGAVIGTGSVITGVAQFTTTTPLAVGTHPITAVYGGDGNDTTATSAAVTVTVTAVTPTVTLKAQSTSLNAGANDTFTATLTPTSATGTVTFKDNGAVIGTGTVLTGIAQFTTTTPLAVGTHPITAVYGGDGNDTSAISTTVIVTVTAVTPTVTLQAQATSIALGTNDTFTATLAPTSATGTVTFKDNGAVIGTGTVLTGVAQFATTTPLAIGTHPITAVYGGDGNDTTATSAAVTVTVTAVTPTVTLQAQATSIALGTNDTFTATLAPTSATGTVTFKDNGAVIGTGTVLTGIAQFTTTTPLAVGTHPITAVYGGDGNDTSAISTTVIVTVTAVTPTVTLQAQATSIALGANDTFTATLAPASATGTVTFKDNGAVIGTGNVVSGVAQFTTTTPLAVGTHPITAVYGGDGNDTTATSGVVVVSVLQLSTSIRLIASAPSVQIGSNETLTATLTAVPGSPVPMGIVVFTDSAGNSLPSIQVTSGVASFSTTALTVGVHVITATYSGDANYAAGSSATVAVTVTLQPVGDFSLSGPANYVDMTATVASPVQIAIATQGGFNQPITFSCSVPSVAVVCTFAPQVVTPTGGTGSTTVQVLFPASASLAPHSGPFDSPKEGIVCAFLLCGTLIGFTRRKTLRTMKSGVHLLLLLASLGIAMGLSGCGASTYSELFTLTITGTSGTVSHQATVHVLVSKPK